MIKAVVPKGHPIIAQRFQRWVKCRNDTSPEGTAEPIHQFQPSLRDSLRSHVYPNVETLGYYQLSLRDNRPVACSPLQDLT
jgi:hypothetical protein